MISTDTKSNPPTTSSEANSTTSEFSEYNVYESPVVEEFLKELNDDAKAMLKDKKVVVLDMAKIEEMRQRMSIINGNAAAYKAGNEAVKASMDKLLLEVKDIYIAVYPLISMFISGRSNNQAKNIAKGIKVALKNKHLFEKLSIVYTQELLIKNGYIEAPDNPALLQSRTTKKLKNG